MVPLRRRPLGELVDGLDPGDHALGDLAPRQKTRQATHLPDLGVALRGIRQDVVGRVPADVQDHRFYRTDIAVDVFDQGDQLVFLARVRSKAVCRAAGLAYLGQQRLT